MGEHQSEKHEKTEAINPKAKGGLVLDDLTEEEKEQLLRYIEGRDSGTKPLEYVLETIGEETRLKCCSTMFLPVLAETTGTYSERLGRDLVAQAAAARCISTEQVESAITVVAAAMLGIKPKDEIEGMLAAQMVAVHNQSMKFLRLAMLNCSSASISANCINIANKLLRTYAIQMETLMKYRRKGNQTVTVEHVHVHKGGQAIVGNITHPRGEEGNDGNCK